jgi:hypothetical protein
VLVGGTTSSNFPTTLGALDTTFGSGAPNTSKNDGFVTRLSASGAALVFSTTSAAATRARATRCGTLRSTRRVCT